MWGGPFSQTLQIKGWRNAFLECRAIPPGSKPLNLFCSTIRNPLEDIHLATCPSHILTLFRHIHWPFLVISIGHSSSHLLTLQCHIYWPFNVFWCHRVAVACHRRKNTTRGRTPRTRNDVNGCLSEKRKSAHMPKHRKSLPKWKNRDSIRSIWPRW